MGAGAKAEPTRGGLAGVTRARQRQSIERMHTFLFGKFSSFSAPMANIFELEFVQHYLRLNLVYTFFTPESVITPRLLFTGHP
jgi:hypothetical protein